VGLPRVGFVGELMRQASEAGLHVDFAALALAITSTRLQARRREYFWQTVPYLGRDPRRVEDVDSRGPDHGALTSKMSSPR
jgi:hypothetical protein